MHFSKDYKMFQICKAIVYYINGYFIKTFPSWKGFPNDLEKRVAKPIHHIYSVSAYRYSTEDMLLTSCFFVSSLYTQRPTDGM